MNVITITSSSFTVGSFPFFFQRECLEHFQKKNFYTKCYLYVKIVLNFVHQLVCVEYWYTFGCNLEINSTNATHKFDVVVMQLHLFLLLQQRRCCSHDNPVCSYTSFRIRMFVYVLLSMAFSTILSVNDSVTRLFELISAGIIG